MNDLTKDEAIKLVVEHSWAEYGATCGHTGCEDHQGVVRQGIHSRRGGIGADWNLDSAVEVITNARQVMWVDSLVGHNLGVETQDGGLVCFDVARPAVES